MTRSTIVFGQSEYVPLAELLYLSAEPDGFLIEVEVFQRDAE